MNRPATSSPRARASALLVVAAHEVELAPLRAGLSRRGVDPERVQTAVVGVGMAAAGAGTARALAQLPARGVLLVGSCGAYPGSRVARLSMVVPHAVCAVDAATVEGRAAMPEAMPQRCACDEALSGSLRAALGEASPGAVATTPSITIDGALATALGAGSGCAVENLEALAVVLACSAWEVPFAALLCCTNDVGPDGRQQWAGHHARAAELTAQAVLRWVAHHAGRGRESLS